MGIVVAIAWPETLVKCVGVWYDLPMKWVGILKNGYYKVGHAAVLLINSETGKVRYFDFGRYQAPIKNGRIRDEETDPELTVKTAAIIKNGKIKNLDDILKEVAINKSTHGKGKLVASVLSGIDFNRAISKTKKWQQKAYLPYGPFDLRGTNCSRFVTKVALFGLPKIHHQIKIRLPYTVSPSPMSNIKLINNQREYYMVKHGQFKVVPFRTTNNHTIIEENKKLTANPIKI